MAERPGGEEEGKAAVRSSHAKTGGGAAGGGAPGPQQGSPRALWRGSLQGRYPWCSPWRAPRQGRCVFLKELRPVESPRRSRAKV